MLKSFYVIGVLLAAMAVTFAQEDEDEEDTPTPPPPAVRPIVAAPQPVQVPATAPPGAPDMVQLQYPNSDVADVLRLYEQLTGKKMVMDNFVQGKVNIFIAKKIPREEAIQIIEMNLLMNGFSLVPAADDIVKVIGTGKNPRTAGIPVLSDESEIPPGEHVVSYLFRLHYADPQELQQVLGQYLSPPSGTYTSFLALPKSGSLLVTENTAVIRKLVKIIDQVDIPPAEVVSEFIKLDRADASKVVDLLKEIFEKGAQPPGVQPQPGPGVRGVRVQPVPQVEKVESELGSLTALTEDAVVVGKIKLTADVRTNRIHVVTRPINMPFVRKLVAQFDANVEFAKPVTRPLRYISAGDVLPVLVQALTEPGAEGAGGAAAGAQGLQPQQQQQQQRQRNSPSSTGLNGTGGSSGEGTLNISEELSTNAVDTTPKAVTIGNAKIIADQRANAIIVLGNREVVVKVQKILDEMDISAPQVALSTVIGELTLSNDEEFGVDYFLRHRRGLDTVGTTNNTGIPPIAGGGTSTSSPGPSPGGTPITTSTGGNIFDPANLISFTQLAQHAASGTNIYLAAGNTLAAVVHALNSTGNFRVISRPMVFTSNNKKAIIASGTEIPVPVSTLSTNQNVVGGVAQQSNIQFKKVALQLEVVPLINSENEVSLDILQKIDSLAGSTTVDGNQIPNIATRYIRTTVAAPNRSTIVLGGLITDSKQKNYNGVPVLDRIPLLGYLFRSTTQNKMRTELIILMRPEVTLTKLDLYRLRQTTKEKMALNKELDKQPPLNQGQDEEEYESSEKQLPPPDLPPVKEK